MTDYGRGVVVDTSAWARAADGRLSGEARRRFHAALAAGRLWMCPPALLELRYAAASDADFAALSEDLGALPYARLSGDVAEAAVVAQSELAAKAGASHRVKSVDLLIAAIASEEGLGVLHYDSDYDAIAGGTSLRFASVWVAPRGSID